MISRHLAMLGFSWLLWQGPASNVALAGDVQMVARGGPFTVHLTSVKEARFRTVVHQQHDFSCGSAAVATLLTYHYHHPVGEDAVFKAMYEVGDHAAIEKNGFSLADMQRYLTTLGYESDGYRVPLETLKEAALPAITLINAKGYNHFVVIKGIKDGDVLVGDPAAGLRVIPMAEFQSMWVGIVFVIRSDPAGASGGQNFNQSAEWMVRRKAPLGTALDRGGLATFATMLPGLREF